VDELEFHTPILIGDLVTCTAEVIYVGHTSMEVAVNVEVEVLEAEQGPQHALSAYFTMVALDRNGRPMAVPPLELETEEAKAAFEAARKRHELYHERKKQRELAKQKLTETKNE
jgi:acyl-CoA hydrolase